MVGVDLQHPDGRRERVRKVFPVQNKRAAEQYERDLRNQLFRPKVEPTTAAPSPPPATKEAGLRRRLLRLLLEFDDLPELTDG